MSTKEDDERFWNFMIYKMYVTNKERDEFMPVLATLVGIGLFIWFILCCFG
jgi:hypothetical protein